MSMRCLQQAMAWFDRHDSALELKRFSMHEDSDLSGAQGSNPASKNRTMFGVRITNIQGSRQFNVFEYLLDAQLGGVGTLNAMTAGSTYIYVRTFELAVRLDPGCEY